MGYYGWRFGSSMPVFGWIIGVAFWVLLIFLVVGLIRWFVSDHNNENSGEDKSDNALRILKERYAKGEISKKEFDQMKKDIS